MKPPTHRQVREWTQQWFGVRVEEIWPKRAFVYCRSGSAESHMRKAFVGYDSTRGFVPIVSLWFNVAGEIVKVSDRRGRVEHWPAINANESKERVLT